MQTRASHVPFSLVSPGECPPTTEGGLTNGVIRPTSDSATGQQGRDDGAGGGQEVYLAARTAWELQDHQDYRGATVLLLRL